MTRDTDDIQRLLSHVKIEEEGGCWIWQSTLTKEGYPRVWFRGKAQQAAHRVMYGLLVEPVPDELDLHHECGRSACINPKHCVPVNRLEHRHEHLVAECPKGHAYTEANTLMVSQGVGRPKKRRCRACTKDYMRAYHLRKKERH